MRYISRWGLMRSSIPENVQEHSHMVAVLAHALGVVRRDVFGEPCDVGTLVCAALYHDAPEILTGDMPTPDKVPQRGHNQRLPGGGARGLGQAGQYAAGDAASRVRAAYKRGGRAAS